MSWIIIFRGYKITTPKQRSVLGRIFCIYFIFMIQVPFLIDIFGTCIRWQSELHKNEWKSYVSKYTWHLQSFLYFLQICSVR